MEAMSARDPRNSPGPYWQRNIRTAFNELRSHGLAEFRSVENNVGQSFSDSPIINVLPTYRSFGKRLIAIIQSNFWPFSHIFRMQVNLTRSWALKALEKESFHLSTSKQIANALTQLRMPSETMLGNPSGTTKIGNQIYSNHYLESLAIVQLVNYLELYRDAESVLEIGGGFAANAHIVLENFPKIGKYLYVDIAPTLYVATQYLKCLYGDAVSDCSAFEDNQQISFAHDDELEIFCILPSQLKQFIGKIDLLYNSHSFVEMSDAIVESYASEAHRLMSDRFRIALLSYHTNDTHQTVSSERLPTFFKSDFSRLETVFPSDGYTPMTLFYSN